MNDTALELFLSDTFQLSDDARTRIIDIFSKVKSYLGTNTTEEDKRKFLSGRPDYELLLMLIGNKAKAEEIASNQVFLNGNRKNQKNDIQNGDGRIRCLMNP